MKWKTLKKIEKIMKENSRIQKICNEKKKKKEGEAKSEQRRETEKEKTLKRNENVMKETA